MNTKQMIFLMLCLSMFFSIAFAAVTEDDISYTFKLYAPDGTELDIGPSEDETDVKELTVGSSAELSEVEFIGDGGSSAEGNTVECGETITGTVLLGHDMDCPSGKAVVIDSSNTTLDCQGHTIKIGTGYGVWGGSWESNVVIQNCIIEGGGSGKGIYLNKPTDTTIQNNILRNLGTAIQSYRSDSGQTILNNTIENVGTGIDSFRDPDTIRNNHITATSTVLHLQGSWNRTVENNCLYGNPVCTGGDCDSSNWSGNIENEDCTIEDAGADLSAYLTTTAKVRIAIDTDPETEGYEFTEEYDSTRDSPEALYDFIAPMEGIVLDVQFATNPDSDSPAWQNLETYYLNVVEEEVEPGPDGEYECGYVINQDLSDLDLSLFDIDTTSRTVRLTQDLTCYPVESYAINIQASDVTFDCQGKSIAGAWFQSTGIRVDAADNVTIQNCVIKNAALGNTGGFEKGISSTDPGKLTIKDSTILQANHGVFLDTTVDSSTADVQIDNVTVNGILNGVRGNSFAGFTFYMQSEGTLANIKIIDSIVSNTERGVAFQLASDSSSIENIEITESEFCEGVDTGFDSQIAENSQLPDFGNVADNKFDSVSSEIEEAWDAPWQDNFYCDGTQPEPEPEPVGPVVVTLNNGMNKRVSYNAPTELFWTIWNLSDREVQLSNAGVTVNGHTCTAENLECAFPDLDTVYKIAPESYYLLRMEVTPSYDSLSEETELPFMLSYTTSYTGESTGGSATFVISLRTAPNPLTLTLLPVENKIEYLHFKVESQAPVTAGECIRADGTVGETGEDAAPRVMLSWEGDDFAINLENYGACDELGGQYYCDSTQFMLELIQKLNEIRQEGESVEALETFKVYLMDDKISLGLRDDFDYVYNNTRGGFYVPLDNYDDMWSKYLTDETRLVFSKSGTGAGLYTAEIGLAFDEGVDEYTFFNGDDEPTATITVTLTLTKEIEPEMDSPFYYLPFNGEVGADQFRAGYGRNYSGDGLELNDAGVITGALGADTVLTYLETDFDKINYEDEGVILQINNGKTEMTFSPIKAVPIMGRMAAAGGEAELFYQMFLEGSGSPFGTDTTTTLLTWAGLGSSNGCSDFYGMELFKSKEDRTPSASACGDNFSNAFGLRFSGIDTSRSGDVLYIASILYLKEGDNSSYITDKCSTSGGTSVQEVPDRIENIQDVIDGIESGKVCVGTIDDKYTYWWNKQRLYKQAELMAVTETGIEVWDTFKCGS